MSNLLLTNNWTILKVGVLTRTTTFILIHNHLKQSKQPIQGGYCCDDDTTQSRQKKCNVYAHKRIANAMTCL